MVLKVAFVGLSLAVTVLLARILGPESYGVYAFAFAVVMLLAIPVQAGLPTLLVREVARYEESGSRALMRGLVRRANQAVAGLALAIGLAAAAVSVLFGDRLSAEQARTFAWALALLPLIGLGNVRGAVLRGLRRVVQGQLPEQIVRPGLFVAALGAFLVLGRELTSSLAMALHAGAALLAFLVGALLLIRALPGEVRRARPAYRTRSWLGSLMPLTLLSGIQLVNSQADIVLLGVLASPEDVGVYRVATQAALLVIFALTAVNLVLAPHLARAYSARDRAELQNLATWSARIVLVTALPVAVALIAFGRPILSLVFGDAYTAGAGALAILCIGQLTNAAAGSVGLILNMTGHEQDTVRGVALAAVINVVLNVALIPPFGIEGAAVATAVSLATWNVVLFRKVRGRVGIISTAWRRDWQEE